jgi:hypothetical protein
MAVTIEVLDISGMSKGERPRSDFVPKTVQPGAKRDAVTFDLPTGNVPICTVNLSEDNKEANIYVIKENTYLPVVMGYEKVQILVSDENEDEFPEQRIATLTPKNRSYALPLKHEGKLTGRYVNFFLED